jgi:hypothetical protein
MLEHDCICTRFASGALTEWGFEKGGETLMVDPPARLIISTAGAAAAIDLAVTRRAGRLFGDKRSRLTQCPRGPPAPRNSFLLSRRPSSSETSIPLSSKACWIEARTILSGLRRSFSKSLGNRLDDHRADGPAQKPSTHLFVGFAVVCI